jgi:hypothetical protein
VERYCVYVAQKTASVVVVYVRMLRVKYYMVCNSVVIQSLDERVLMNDGIM